MYQDNRVFDFCLTKKITLGEKEKKELALQRLLRSWRPKLWLQLFDRQLEAATPTTIAQQS